MLTRQYGIQFCEQVDLREIAKTHGTPTYVYSQTAIEQAYGEFASAAAGRDVLVCFGVKANSNLAVLQCLARLGAGFDIVSGGELQRVLKAGASANKIVFSGVGKTEQEMRDALSANILCFNIESVAELDRLQQVAATMDLRAPISIRVNPNVDAGTHPYISTGLKENKFGIAHELALGVYQNASTMPNIKIVGIDCHIGSQITDTSPFVAALDRLLDLVEQLAQAGIMLEHIDLGGGFGIRYKDEQPPSRAKMFGALFKRLDEWRAQAPSLRSQMSVVFEIGRSMVGNAGVLLTQVEYTKQNGDKSYAVVDAAMNDLLRPTLYGAYHHVSEVQQPKPGAKPPVLYDVVGPVCESGDWLAKERSLSIHQGSLLAIESAGAYGMSMSSNYNTRGRAAEVLVKGNQFYLIRERETVDDQLRLERLLP